MRNCLKALVIAPIVMLASSAVILAQTAAPANQAAAQPPANARDISGVWLGDGGGNNRPLLSQPAAKLMQPWVKARFNSQGVTTEPDMFLEACEPLGVPRVLLTNTPVKIMQTTSEVVMLYERNHDFREVYIDGREHPKSPDATWWGHSIGKWEGPVFVVDTVGLTDRTWIDWTGLPHTEDLRVVERYQRLSATTMQMEITIDDPKAYTQPFTVKRIFTLKPNWTIGEDICTRSDEQYFRQGIVHPATETAPR